MHALEGPKSERAGGRRAGLDDAEWTIRYSWNHTCDAQENARRIDWRLSLRRRRWNRQIHNVEHRRLRLGVQPSLSQASCPCSPCQHRKRACDATCRTGDRGGRTRAVRATLPTHKKSTESSSAMAVWRCSRKWKSTRVEVGGALAAPELRTAKWGVGTNKVRVGRRHPRDNCSR